MDEEGTVYCLYELHRFPRSEFETTPGGLVHKVTPPHFSSGFLARPGRLPGTLTAAVPFRLETEHLTWDAVEAHLRKTTLLNEA